MSPLESATTPELLTELTRRYTSGIFAAKSILSDDTVMHGKLIAWGDPLVVLGMAKQIDLYTQVKIMPMIVAHIQGENEELKGDADGSR